MRRVHQRVTRQLKSLACPQLLEQKLLEALHAGRRAEQGTVKVHRRRHLWRADAPHTWGKQWRVTATVTVELVLMIGVVKDSISIVLLEGRDAVFTVSALLGPFLVEAGVRTDDLARTASETVLVVVAAVVGNVHIDASSWDHQRAHVAMELRWSVDLALEISLRTHKLLSLVVPQCFRHLLAF